MILLWLSMAQAGPPVSDQSPQLYLEEATVREHLHRQLPVLAPCFEDLPAAPQEFELSFRLGRDGRAEAPSLTPASPEREACIAEAFDLLGFPRHHEDPLEVVTLLVPREGRLVPHPLVSLPHRPKSLVFLYLSDPVLAEQVRAQLGTEEAAD